MVDNFGFGRVVFPSSYLMMEWIELGMDGDCGGSLLTDGMFDGGWWLTRSVSVIWHHNLMCTDGHNSWFHMAGDNGLHGRRYECSLLPFPRYRVSCYRRRTQLIQMLHVLKSCLRRARAKFLKREITMRNSARIPSTSTRQWDKRANSLFRATRRWARNALLATMRNNVLQGLRD